MLHTPIRAQRRATTTEPFLSVTLDTLPADVAYYRYAVAPGHHLIVVRDRITYGALHRAYQKRLPTWARRRLYASCGVVDPADDPAEAARTRWWNDDWLITRAAVGIVECTHPGLIIPWPHAWGLSTPA